jgi:cobalamin biosynthesis protein CbiG
LHYTLRLQSSNLVRIKNINIKNTGANFGSGIHITRNAQSIVIDGCKVEVNASLKTKVFYPIAFTSNNKLDITDPVSSAKNGSNNKIVRNELIGGYAGVALLGASQVDYDVNNIVDSNIIRDFYHNGILHETLYL